MIPIDHKVLVIKVGGLGDVLMATPALRSLKKSFPSCYVYFATGLSNKAVLRNNPHVDEIIDINDTHLLAGHFPAKFTEALRLLRVFRRIKPDETFILHRDWRYNLLAFLSGAENRYGFRRDLKGLFLTQSVADVRDRREIEKYLAVFSLKEGFCSHGTEMDLFPSRTDVQLADDFFARLSGSSRWIAMAPGGAANVKIEMETKRWPLEYYTQLAGLLLGGGFGILLIGGASDRHFTQQISAEFIGKQVVDCAGMLSIHGTYLVLKRCSILVTHDCGPMHVGACTGIPIISIFGPTAPTEYAPWGIDNCFCFWAGDTLPCAPCHAHGRFPVCSHRQCMYRVTSEMVYLKVNEILAAARQTACDAGQEPRC
ncbi:MAG: glycosyltransferase family 9 protein [Phycisphaerales bacterium]|nr:MAG: glycosyltransferase family 9 protein [Phycisphaerales bacterium]